MADRDYLLRTQQSASLPLDPDSVITRPSDTATPTPKIFVSPLVDVSPFPEDFSGPDIVFSPSENALAPEFIVKLAESLPAMATPETSVPIAPPAVTPEPPVSGSGCGCNCKCGCSGNCGYGLCLPQPYPIARCYAENERYARIIRNSFCGRESVLTSMMNYLYHALQFSECSNDIKVTLLGIAACKMHHLRLLGEILSFLGGDPKFFYNISGTGKASNWWAANPATLSYAKNLGEALRADIALEKALIEEHHNAINYIDDNGVCNVLKRIVPDEEYHLKILNELYQRFCS